MRARLAVLMLASVTCFAGQKVTFFDTWEPQPALLDLWRPMCECWWENGQGMHSPQVAAHFKDYARHNSPEAIVPQIFADLKRHDTDFVETAYTFLLAEWPRNEVLRLLEPYRHSADPKVRRIATLFHNNIAEWKGG